MTASRERQCGLQFAGVEDTPMKRFGDAEELAVATLLLASGAGSFMTGTELIVDGGYAAMTI